MNGDTIIYLIMGAIILFLSYEFWSIVKERDKYREECGNAKLRLKVLNLPPPAPPAPTIEERKFIVLENAGDNGTLNHQVAIYINDGYIFDHEASNDKYLAFYKIIPVINEDEV